MGESVKEIKVGQVYVTKESKEPIMINDFGDYFVDWRWFEKNGAIKYSEIGHDDFNNTFEFVADSMSEEDFKQWCMTGKKPALEAINKIIIRDDEIIYQLSSSSDNYSVNDFKQSMSEEEFKARRKTVVKPILEKETKDDEIIYQSPPVGQKQSPPIGKKHDTNKPRFSLLPSQIWQVIDVLEFGAKRYGVDNWQKVDNSRERYFNACHRHLQAWWGGERLDAESGLPHLAHAVCCLLFLMWGDDELAKVHD